MPGTAHAVEETEIGKTVARIAVNDFVASIAVNNYGPSGSCALALMFFDPITASGRIWYATLLEALSTGATVDVYYERSGANCTITQLVVY